MARRTSSSLTKSTAFAPLFEAGATSGLLTGSGGRSDPPFVRVSFGAGATYMLPASLSGGAGRGNGEAAGSMRLPARNRSTIAAISCRSIFPPATTGSFVEAETGCVETAGRALFTGLVSKATRLMSIKCSGDTLSDVTFPPHDPQPNVIDGGSAVEKPIAPCVVGVLTVIRDAGISAPNFTAASRERV